MDPYRKLKSLVWQPVHGQRISECSCPNWHLVWLVNEWDSAYIREWHDADCTVIDETEDDQ